MNEEILRVTPDGEFIWHDNADNLIKTGDFSGSPSMPHILRRLRQRDALLEALKDAATSLETVGRLAGKSDYLGDAGERIPTYMGRHDEVREYATSRAGVARAAIKAVKEGK